jgi:hypothetical protein
MMETTATTLNSAAYIAATLPYEVHCVSIDEIKLSAEMREAIMKSTTLVAQ